MNVKWPQLHEVIKTYIYENPECTTWDVYYHIMDKPAKMSNHYHRRRHFPAFLELSGMIRFLGAINVSNDIRCAKWVIKDM